MSRILVIKHGALGDVILATGPFAAIRDYHSGDHITLLTTQAYAGLLEQSPYFDDVWIDKRSRMHQFLSFFKLIKKIRKGRFIRIYDLQTSERTSWYFKLLREPKPEWVGTAAGASHQHNTPDRTRLHTVERQKQQLAIAGIPSLPRPNIDWLCADVSRFALPERYALIVPGGSSHRPGKRWPAIYYAQLCSWLNAQGILPVLIGTHTESNVLSTIEHICPGVKTLQGKTGFAELAQLARGALFAVGNDTGPMHLIATAGCSSLVLFSKYSDPVLCAPRGTKVVVMSETELSKLDPGRVIYEAQKFLS